MEQQEYDDIGLQTRLLKMNLRKKEIEIWGYGDKGIGGFGGWRYGNMEIWIFGDKGYEIGDMV